MRKRDELVMVDSRLLIQIIRERILKIELADSPRDVLLEPG